VSKYLLFESDPIDQPAATDPVERLTWCALRIRVGQRFASRIWDKSLQSERMNLYVPGFPIAEWVVENWWSLFNELCPADRVPTSVTSGAQLKWIRRHCLRSADSALMLPALYLFHDGQSLRAEWQSDSPGSMLNMPGEFITDGGEPLEANLTQESLTTFINDCLNRLAEVSDHRVYHMAEQWKAIQRADVEERHFCSLAGRMGLDPYDDGEMTEELVRFLEQAIIRPEDPLVRDLTEVARREFIVQQWSWLTRVSAELGLGPNPVDLSFGIPSRALSPPFFGYELASKVRALAKISANAPLDSVEAVGACVTGKTLRFEDRNHTPGQGIRAIVGRSAGDIVCAGPAPSHANSKRFLIARSLYHAMVTTQSSHRLVTDAFSWEQKASRAFAAELLAPRRVLAERISTSSADSDAIESLSREFKASTIVIERQLENAGISLSGE
jgi:Zn-dependent peptidase ImmA (M78 family)